MMLHSLKTRSIFTLTLLASAIHTHAQVAADATAAPAAEIEPEIEQRNLAPTIQTASLKKAREGERFTQTIKAKDPENGSLSFSLMDAPAGMNITGDGTIEWLPEFDAAGSHNIKVEVSDGELSSTATLTLHVANQNRKPVVIVLSENSQQSAENAPFSLVIEANDPDGDELSYKLTKAPKGMKLDGNTINWTPNFNQAGQHNIKVKISDSESNITQSFIVDIENTNRPPVWTTTSIRPRKEGQLFATQVSAKDADGNAINYSLESGPEGMSLSPSGKLQWKPDYDSAGEHPLVFVANDGEDSTPLEMTLVIENTNRKPGFSSEPISTGAEAQAYTYSIISEDPDGDNVSLKLLKSPNGMTLDGTQLNWTPGYKDAGAYTVLLETTDGELKAQQKYLLKIANTNQAPVITLPTAEKLATQETRYWNSRIGLSDPDGDTVQLTLLQGPTGLTLKGNKLSWKPGYEQAGEHQVLLEAKDREDSTPAQLTISVANLNRKPVITNTAPKQAAENQPYSHQVQANDADQTPLSYQLVQAPEGMSIDESGLINWTPNFEQAGKHTVQINVSDGEDSAGQTVNIQVANTNRAPVFNSNPVLSGDENSTYSYSIDAADPDRQPVSLRLTQAPKGLTLQENTLSWKPGFTDAGDYPITISANDGKAKTEQSFTLTINNTNRLPEITSQPETRGIESIPYSYGVTAQDADGEALTLRLSQAPEGMRIDNGTITWLPGYEQAGKHPVIIDVSDGLDSSQQQFMVQVANTNREPSITSINNKRLRAGKTFEHTLKGSDIDGSKVSYRLIYGPKGLRLREGNKLYWETDNGDTGTHTIIVSVSDGDLKVREHFDLTITRD